MEYLAEWHGAGRQLIVKTNTSDKPNTWQGRLVNIETPVERLNLSNQVATSSRGMLSSSCESCRVVASWNAKAALKPLGGPVRPSAAGVGLSMARLSDGALGRFITTIVEKCNNC